MHIIHGTWIPEDTNEFIQRGAFYLWVETDTPPGTKRSRTGTVHPPQRFEPHDPRGGPGGLLQREVDAVAHRVQRLQRVRRATSGRRRLR